MGTFLNVSNRKALYIVELGRDESDGAIKMENWSPCSVHVSGELSGGRVVISGSNNLVNQPDFSILNDVQGNPLVFEAPGLEQIQEDCHLLNVRVAGGTPETNVRVAILLRT